MTQTYQTGFRTTLAAKLDAAATTMTVATAPTVTAGRVRVGTGNSRERISYTGVSGTTLTGLTRGLSRTAIPATAGTGKSHIAGTKVVLVAMHDQLPDKQQDTEFEGDFDIDGDLTLGGDLSIEDTSFTQSISGSNWRIRKNGDDMTFRDDNQSDVTLSQLASAAGVNDKVKVSSDDTTEGYLNEKITTGDGLSKTITNPAGNEVLDIDIDLSDTNVFVETSAGAGDAGKVPLLDAAGQIDPTMLPTPVVVTSLYDTITFTYDVSTASGTQVVNHSLGADPQKIDFNLYVGANFSDGGRDGTNNVCVYGANDSSAKGTDTVALRTGVSTDLSTGTITAVSSTTFTITWVKSGNQTGTANIVARLYRITG